MFFLLNKPVGISSFRAIALLRKRLAIKKIGHTGTLDPLASGLLLVATDHSTKLIPYIDKERKTYVFTVRLDGTTDSLDLDTPVRPLDPALVQEWWKDISRESIESILRKDFLGTHRQIPPVYSALNIDGRRAYELARAGREVALKERTVEIYSCSVVDFAFPEVTIEAEVSVGTYIRSIARDLGERLGLAGYVTMLHRSRIGALTEDLAHEVDEIDASCAIPYDRLFPDFDSIDLDSETTRLVQHGIVFPNTLGLVEGRKYLARHAGSYVSLIETRDGMVRVCINKIA